MDLIKQLRNTTTYFQKGINPTLLILSGTHGDEFQVIDSVKLFIEKYYLNFPDFIFVPEVSPSAVKQKTRVNCRNLDLNRVFTDNSQDDEVVSLKSIFEPYHFRWCLSFHEDPDTDSFYMYDSGKLELPILNKFKDTLRSSDISLFSGIDDPNDPLLKIKIQEGYYSIKPDYNFSDGFLMDYVIKKNICDRFITLEIPGKADKQTNYRITSVVLNVLRSTLGF